MKRLLLLLISIVVTAAVMANPVSKREALLKARQFMPFRQFKKGKVMMRAKGAPDGCNPFYVFNDENSRGFVIVSGDDRTVPILGYSDSGIIDEDYMPDNLRCWLEGYAKQIGSLYSDELDDDAILPAPLQTSAIAPLLSTKWNQGAPYYYQTPTYTYSDGKAAHYMTGCVATAIAQVMYYHRWPHSCSAIPEYTTNTLQIYRPELPATTFNWNLMKDVYDYQETGASADAVAELMAYVGQAVAMDYNVNGSGAVIRLDAMANLFSYSRNAYRALRADYSIVEWENLIYNELACNRPVLYSGGSARSMHQFVCDGYDGDGLFHINWGWGGNSDGYFVLSLANPSEKGAGGGTGTGGYEFSQAAIIGLQPASEDEPELPFFTSNTECLPEANYSRNSTEVDFENISTPGCWLSACYTLPPTTTCDIEAGWAVYVDEHLENVVASKQIHIDNQGATWGNYYGPNKFSFGAGLADGNYKLVPVYRYLGNSNWNIISTINCIYAHITDNMLSVRGYNRNATYTVNNIAYKGDMGEGSTMTVTINITNTSDVMQETACFWMRGSGDWINMGDGIGNVEPGQTGNIHLLITPDAAGTYEVKITSDYEGEKVMGTSTVTIFAVKQTTLDGLVFLCNQGTKEAKLIRGDYSSYGWESLEIPSSVNLDGEDYTVTRIDEWALWNIYSLQKVVLPEGLLSIGEYAFCSCYNLNEVQLPSTLTAIGDYAFDNCSNLNMVVSLMTEPCTINRNVFTITKWIDDTSFEKFSTATLYVPIGTKTSYESSAVWNEFNKIYQGELKKVTIDGITYSYATGEEVATIVGSDKEVLNGKDVVIPSAIYVDGKSCSVKDVANSAFRQCLINTLTIEPGIEEIGEWAFSQINSLQKVVLPEGLLGIGEHAFDSCWGLNEVQLPSTLTAIGDYAFNSCYWLNEVQLPSTLIAIGDYAFGNCSKLNTIVSLMTEPCTINRNVFTITKWIDDTSFVIFSTATLYVPIGTKAIYQSTDVWQEFSIINEFDETDIKNISDSDAVEIKRYNVNGVRLDTPQKGLNITRMSDGSIRKIMVK